MNLHANSQSLVQITMNHNPPKESLLRSKEIDEVIGRPPHWLIQWGISVFLTILVLVVILSYFIRYPETINLPFYLKSDIPLCPVGVDNDGRVIKMLAGNGASVKRGDSLLIWKSTSDKTQQVLLSPATGKVNLIAPINNGERFRKNKFFLFITPLKSSYSAILQVNCKDIEKVKLGQRVDLSLQNDPDRDLYGKIDFISALPKDNKCLMKVISIMPIDSIPYKPLELREGMLGSARIIINNKRFIDKLIGNSILPKKKIN